MNTPLQDRRPPSAIRHRRSNPWPGADSRGGFTIIEMLAALIVFGVLMFALFTAYNHANRAWLLGERRVETFQDARLALETMSRELETAIATSNGLTGVALTFINRNAATTIPGNGLSGCAANAAPADLVATPPNDQLFFIGSASDTTGQSYHDLTEYGYYVVYATDSYQTMKKGGYYLIRHMATASNYFDCFSCPATWFHSPGYSTSTKVPLLDNVLRLWLTFDDGTNTPASWSDTLKLPRAVQIRLAVIDRRTAARLDAATGGTVLPTADLSKVIPNGSENLTGLANGPVKNILLEGVHYFTKTVYLRNHP